MKHERTHVVQKTQHLTRLIACFLLVFVASIACISVSAQSGGAKIKVTGFVTDNLGEPLVGASVGEKGTTNATMTGVDGDYELNVPANATLVVTYVGFTTREIPVQGKTKLDITLNEDARLLDEVVVTALGIKREARSLGYAVQEVKADVLLETREPNVTNSLSGRVAGLQVIRSSNGVGGSSKIVLRGFNSLSGSNQPLIVVDGIPIDNTPGGVDSAFGTDGMDMGNGLADINPEDVESMSVLKGASAAALYGARAGNGVILITTKSGKKTSGVGITINSGIQIETLFMQPEMQKTFGQGSLGDYNASARTSWGPRITGQQITSWNGETTNMRAYDNVNNFLRTGVSSIQGASFQREKDGTAVFVSINRADEQSTTPEAKLNRTNSTVRASTFLDEAKKWKVDGKFNYVNTNAHNRPIQGINPSNVYKTLYTLPVSLDIRDFEAAVDQNGRMLWYDNATTPQENPYWVTRYRLNDDTRDRFMGVASLVYSPTTWLNVELKGGTDYFTTLSTERTHAGSPNAKGGGLYNENSETFYENNFSFLATARKDNLVDRLGISGSFGGNLMYQQRRELRASAGELLVPNVFSLDNSLNGATVSSALTKRRINSLYGTAQLNWDGYLFLDLTARNDWSSTLLIPDNYSFFYPSVSLSYVISDMLAKQNVSMPSWMSFAKLRASYAEVGNDLPPYQLYNPYFVGKDALRNTTLTSSKVKYNSFLKSELVKSWEIGADLRFLDGRIGVDAAWYRSNATNQLLELPMDPFSGFAFEKVNAGDIQNQGFELSINSANIESPQGFNWTTIVNFSSNRTKIKELTDAVSLYNIKSFEDIQVVARTGGRYGDMYGKKLLRVEDKDSPHYGKAIVDASGLPLATTDNQYLGNQSPDWMLGVNNMFSYKNVSLSFLVDARVGGKMFSGTTALLHGNGNAKGTVFNGDRKDFVVPNTVVADGSGGYKENNVAVTMQNYWGRLTGQSTGSGNFGLAEMFTYDATNVRLRNITVGYSFDKKLLAKTPFQRVNISAICNNVWMIYSKLPGIDPESVTSTNTNAVGIENSAAPTSRTFVFNLTIGF